MVTVDKQIFSREWVGTPREISAFIRAFCAGLNAEGDPLYLDVTPDADAAAPDSLKNVNAKIARDGGHVVFGWIIREWPGVCVEAEHHAVWSDGQSLHDVTPHRGGGEKSLFLPDPDRTFDPETGQPEMTRRTSFGTLAAADTWIRETDKLQDYVHQNTEGGRVKAQRSVLDRLSRNARVAQMQVIVDLARTRGRNDDCICRSGKKFKKCCAPLIHI